VALGLTAALAACQHVGQFVWVDAYQEPVQARSATYAIGVGDVVSVRVFGQEGMSARVRVRPDGKVSLPFLADVAAAGLEPVALAARIQERLKEFVVNPVVTVALEEAAPLEISVVGEVARPGVYRLEPEAGVLNALAAAGGPTEYARLDRLFVLRPGAKEGGRIELARIRLTYEALSRAEGRAAKLHLRKGDVVVVE
jgi:polysaccharide export outer membrane protein